MRFTLIKDIKKDTVMQPVLGALLFFALLYLISDILVKQSSFGITPAAVSATLFGDEEQFLEALSEASFLEFWHTEIFFSMMLLFTMSAVYIRLYEASKKAMLLVHLLFISALLALFALPLAYFVDPAFVNIYSFSFIVWHLSALIVAFCALQRLYFAKSV
ncbi:MAG: hypothetical protein WBK95_10350 [Sulfurimonas sp.]